MCEKKTCPRCGAEMQKTTSSLDTPMFSSATVINPSDIKPDQTEIETWECPNCGVIL
jgi:predicted RNA-binding Zn-ribbon protein involved in translation (DUF1610 family)